MQSKEIENIIDDRLKGREVDIALKRLGDIILSAILMVLLSPLMLVIAVAIKLDSSGPVIFKQDRVGTDGKLFVIYKFRTMVKNAEKLFKLNIDKENLGNLVFQDKNDSRITGIGKFLRETSLDELPQLFNVFIGNMSLVGPRPEIPDVANLYDDMQKLRLKMKPGITGLAQVSGRGEIELDRTIQLDLIYIQSFSIINDIKILLRTVLVVFKREGAY